MIDTEIQTSMIISLGNFDPTLSLKFEVVIFVLNQPEVVHGKVNDVGRPFNEVVHCEVQ